MATNYTAGDLNVTLLGDSINAEKSIDNVIAKLKSLQKALTLFSTVNTQAIGTNLSQTFTQISTAINSLDISNLDKLSNLNSAVSSLGSFINALNSTAKVDSAKITTNLSNIFNGLNQSISLITQDTLNKIANIGISTSSFSTFINAINRVGKIDASKLSSNLTQIFTALSQAVNTIDDKTLKKLETIGNATQGLSALKSLGLTKKTSSKKGGFGLLNIASWTTVIYLARRLGSTVTDIVQKGADYTETLNLWEVAMRGNNDQATDFVNKMNEAYGISKKTLMNAQATFKNMLGSLGDITDAMAYQLSEGVTQMAVDYASLYNVKFEDAFTKFEAALAGQVRPIRSISGYDITENTLYQLYQTIGGTKTVRQLTITEKRLLSILAIFKQMESSGAVGDLGKTLSSFANQSRVMAESWQEVLSYAGLIITHLIEQSGLLSYINGLLIFAGDVLEAVASDMGAIKSFGGDIFGGTENSALNATEAVEELQGKLLGFDKFRVMNSQEESDAPIDQILANALSSYTSIIDKADLGTAEIVNNLKQASGLFDENGVFQPEKWQEIEKGINNVAKAIGGLLFGGTIYGVITLLTKAFTSPIIAFAGAYLAITSILNLFTDETAKEIASWCAIVVGAVMAVAGAIMALQATANPMAIPLLLAGIGTALAGITALTPDIELFSVGASNIDSGTMFIAGESGKTEMVYNGGNGRTNVANVQQMKSAFYQALVEYGKSNNNSQPIVVTIDGQEVFYATRKVANQNGLDFSNVR